MRIATRLAKFTLDPDHVEPIIPWQRTGQLVEHIGPYLQDLVARLRAILCDELVGAYAGGSYALGDLEEGRSDLDVAAVCSKAIARSRKTEIVAALRQESLHCPARGLEFVLYREAATRVPTIEPAFELNLNTGPRMAFRADLEPAAEQHWFAVDRAILRACGMALFGPPVEDVFAAIPREALLELLVESVHWHRANLPTGSDAVLNTCRALRFAADGAWSSKRQAGNWAIKHRHSPKVIVAALRARKSRKPLEGDAVQSFLQEAEVALRTLHPTS